LTIVGQKRIAKQVYHNSIGEDWSEPYYKSEWLDYVKPENKALADIFFNGVWTKGVCWETTNHVPLLLRVPGAKKGLRSDALVELLDIYPTLCEATGLKTPTHCEGRSLLPLLKVPERSWSAIASSQFRKGKVVARSIRTDRYRFTLWEKGKGNIEGIELYDYKSDPEGTINLAASPDNKRLLEKMKQLHRSGWPTDYWEEK